MTQTDYISNTPKKIKAILDEYVMGQEKGTKAVALAVGQHLLRIKNNRYISDEDIPIPKDNLLIIGPTGCGKTETIRTLERMGESLGVPVAMFNTLDYSGTGSWRNSKPISSIFDTVFKKAADIYYEKNGDSASADIQHDEIARIANTAIVVLDEIDKIALRGEDNGLLMLKEYQSTLLKMIEGNTYQVSDFTHTCTTRRSSRNSSGEIDISDNIVDSTDMMFIMMGAFSNIEQITIRRLIQEKKIKMPCPAEADYQETHIGFTAELQPQSVPAESEFAYEQLVPTQDDIINYGFMPELVGRINIRTVYKPLSIPAMVDILLNCKTSAYRVFQKKFQAIGHELKCDKAALEEIAKIAVERGTGARSLRTIFDEFLYEAQYELTGDNRHIRCLLRGRDIKAGKPPILHDRTKLKYRQIRRLRRIMEQHMADMFDKKRKGTPA